jgi:cytochrome c-type biogenesis protein CcmH/NrfF
MTRLLLIILLLVPAGLSAQDAVARADNRTPEEAEMLYKQIGAGLFCICGCRENLLTCSMNVCSSKNLQRDYLRALCRDPELGVTEIKEAMAARFGANVLQVPPRSSLYPMLGLGVLLLVGAFGFGFWALTRGRDPRAETYEGIDTETLARIERDMKELE